MSVVCECDELCLCAERHFALAPGKMMGPRAPMAPPRKQPIYYVTAMSNDVNYLVMIATSRKIAMWAAREHMYRTETAEVANVWEVPVDEALDDGLPNVCELPMEVYRPAGPPEKCDCEESLVYYVSGTPRVEGANDIPVIITYDVSLALKEAKACAARGYMDCVNVWQTQVNRYFEEGIDNDQYSISIQSIKA